MMTTNLPLMLIVWSPLLVTSFTLCVRSEGKEENEELLMANDKNGSHIPPEDACGIISLHQAIREAGFHVSRAQMYKEIPLSPLGCSMGDLCRFLEKNEIPHCAVTASEILPVVRALVPKTRTAILHVDDGSHFIAVMNIDSKTLATFDQFERIQPDVYEVISKRYSGAALLVGTRSEETVKNELVWRTGFRIVLVALGGGLAGILFFFVVRPFKFDCLARSRL